MDLNNTIELSAVLKKWKIVFLFAIIGLVISYCYASFFVKPSYLCSRSYFINNNAEYSNDSMSKTPSINDITVSKELVETYRQYMANPNVLLEFAEHLKEQYGYNFSYPQLGSYIKVDSAGDTSLIQIHVTTGDKKLSSDISAAIDAYLIPKASDDLGYTEIKKFGDRLVEKDIIAKPLSSGFYGAVIGILFGVGFAFILCVFDNKITEEDEFVKKFGIPVLGNIPELSADSKGRYKK